MKRTPWQASPLGIEALDAAQKLDSASHIADRARIARALIRKAMPLVRKVDGEFAQSVSEVLAVLDQALKSPPRIHHYGPLVEVPSMGAGKCARCRVPRVRGERVFVRAGRRGALCSTCARGGDGNLRSEKGEQG